jgi:uncharacterized membrane protein YphA (DoxX/SURF4 family)
VLEQLDGLWLVVLAGCLFFAILFLQSGCDKIFDWKGNRDWLTGHFAQSPFRGVVPLLLATITLFEVGTGVVSVLAAVMMLLGYMPTLQMIAFGLAAVTFLMLFLGQRLAKDYVGAATIATYFAVALIALAATSFL